MSSLQGLREKIRGLHRAPEKQVISDLIGECAPAKPVRDQIKSRAIGFVKDLRQEQDLSLMEVFLAEYGLSTDEGVALMCLAEALLRVPDQDTIDALIEDKIVPSNWAEHVGDSSSTLVNTSTLALLLVGKVLDPAPPSGVLSVLQGAVKRLGEPVIRVAIGRAMKMLGKQFVLGQTIEEAVRQGHTEEKRGFNFSYDMLGEAAMTAADAQTYYNAYTYAIEYLAQNSVAADSRDNPGISIKLSALHPRYELAKRDRIMAELVPRVRELALAARQANMGLNIDAEEADRLDLSLDIIEAILRDPAFSGWDGFGVVVQAYGKRAGAVVDWLHALASDLDRSIMVRLVKGAYWDTEVKRAQVDGVEDYPVFTRKVATDVSYICCANKLLGMTDRIYPQFATHNAHTVAAILELAGDEKPFEFQRLHGMGESLLNTVMSQENCRCRIYAPVGAHQDLLAYLVRRLLENGANSSFVNQIIDESVPAETVAADPFDNIDARLNEAGLNSPVDLYGPTRRNARGWDLRNNLELDAYEAARAPFLSTNWQATPPDAVCHDTASGVTTREIISPANLADVVGSVAELDARGAAAAIERAAPWSAPVEQRSKVLLKAADLYEAYSGEIFALLSREAGKTPLDAIAELREAVDFLRYYAVEALKLDDRQAAGLFTCISPWNFPLAIFTGQIAAALVTGNGVLAKPAETTPLIAALAVRLLHQAGVPGETLQLVPGEGAVVGHALTSDPRIAGVCFTGSTATAQRINRTMAEHLSPHAPLIAETGGINAMIVDSTALAEQAVRDIVASAFQSAGQRCSALRMLYVQEDVADGMLEMLFGAMDELQIGDPWQQSTDVGPVIDRQAKDAISQYINEAAGEGRLLKQLEARDGGHFVAPAVLSVSGIEALEREVFGPVLHVATFAADDIDDIVDAVNNCGYGLTFGLHTRINERVDHIRGRIRVGNMYVNRNQIGAIVGSQPFGGEGLSGTGPKAGGPHYLARFCKEDPASGEVVEGENITIREVQRKLSAMNGVSGSALHTKSLPGPTGERNELSTHPRGLVLCLGPTAEAAAEQAALAESRGCTALQVAPGATGDDAISGYLARAQLEHIDGFAAVALWSSDVDASCARRALSAREGPLIPLLATREMARWCVLERHICIDTTAAGGNASLLAENL